MKDTGTCYPFKDLIRFDLLRYSATATSISLLRGYFSHPEFRYIFWMRVCAVSRRQFARLPIHLLSRFMLRRLGHRYGISIPYNTAIGPGFYIGHAGSIVVSPKARIGKNCNISCGVVIGETFRGERTGVPQIGDYVYIAPGAKIIGNIRIGNNVAIGANCVVTRDLPDNAVAVGVPAKVISMAGSDGYITRIV